MKGDYNSKYITQQNDTWDLISFKLFGDEKYTSHLLQSNTELTKIVIFQAGVIINVPVITQQDEVPPWVSKIK